MQDQFNRDQWLTNNETLVAVKDGEDKARVLGLRLIAVAKVGDGRRAELLIEAGADINVQDKEGMTAMHHAAANGARPCIRVLIATQKVDCTLHDEQYRYASDLAIEWAGDYAVGRLLSKHQARQAFARGIPVYVFPAAATDRRNGHKLST